jgi:hypothetical protein
MSDAASQVIGSSAQLWTNAERTAGSKLATSAVTSANLELQAGEVDATAFRQELQHRLSASVDNDIAP